MDVHTRCRPLHAPTAWAGERCVAQLVRAAGGLLPAAAPARTAAEAHRALLLRRLSCHPRRAARSACSGARVNGRRERGKASGPARQSGRRCSTCPARAALRHLARVRVVVATWRRAGMAVSRGASCKRSRRCRGGWTRRPTYACRCARAQAHALCVDAAALGAADCSVRVSPQTARRHIDTGTVQARIAATPTGTVMSPQRFGATHR